MKWSPPLVRNPDAPTKRGRPGRVRTSPCLPLGATPGEFPRNEMSKAAATYERSQRRFPRVSCRRGQSQRAPSARTTRHTFASSIVRKRTLRL
jgi:hypothetical protein